MSHAKTDTLRRRHQAVRATLAEQNLDALVVTSLPNILYLTNFTGSSAIVILTADRLELLTDFRYVTAVRELQRDGAAFELATVDGSYDAMLAKRLAALPEKPVVRVGIESAHLTVARHLWLTTTLARDVPGTSTTVTLVATEGMIERARVRKDGD